MEIACNFRLRWCCFRIVFQPSVSPQWMHLIVILFLTPLSSSYYWLVFVDAVYTLCTKMTHDFVVLWSIKESLLSCLASCFIEKYGQCGTAQQLQDFIVPMRHELAQGGKHKGRWFGAVEFGGFVLSLDYRTVIPLSFRYRECVLLSLGRCQKLPESECLNMF